MPTRDQFEEWSSPGASTLLLVGLSPEEVEASRARHGSNVLTPPIREPWWRLYLKKFNDPVIRVLLLAAAAAFAVGAVEGHYVESAGILGAIFLSTFIAFVNEFHAAKQFDLLSQSGDDTRVKVLRAGVYAGVARRDVVVGDIVILDGGEELPADGELLEAVALLVDESSLTGESEAVEKCSAHDAGRAASAETNDAAYPPFKVLRGTLVLSGRGTLRVTATGDRTEVGQSARAAAQSGGDATTAPTPLSRQLELLSKRIGVVGFGIALLQFGVLIAGGVARGELNLSVTQPPHAATQLLSYFMAAVTLLVVAVPEGLAMSVTLSLAYSMKKMAAAQCLVRRMHACETIGAVSVICSDKTGTLTLGEMRVNEACFPALDQNGGATRALIAEAISVNSSANLTRAPGRAPAPLGNPTEGALLLWLDALEVDYVAQRREFQILKQWPFSTELKFMATLGRSARGGGAILHAKGAPELLLRRCENWLAETGAQPLDSAGCAGIESALKRVQAQGMRTLGLACREFISEEHFANSNAEALVCGMTWLGYFVIADPLRPDVPGAIRACQRAGIEIKIVTGDNHGTALEIARQAGLRGEADPPGAFMTGPEFEKLSDAELGARLDGLKVLSRARPLDKLRLVCALQAHGKVVAATGDGSNDAPALKRADVGISMGLSGTAVAREASDIVLLDDSFQSIARAVLWGRSLYENIQHFIVFQLTVNAAALGIALLGPLAGVRMPLTVVQMLWVNMIMDTLAALALASEGPRENVMERAPRNPRDFIVNASMARSILATGALFLGALLALLIYFSRHFDAQAAPAEQARALTLFFTFFVLLQLWNLFNARRAGSSESALGGLAKNKLLPAVAGLVLLVQIAIVQFGGAVFRTVPLSAIDWAALLASTSCVLWLSELARWIARRRKKSAH